MRLYNWHSTISPRWVHLLLLLIWLIIGLGLRFANLTAKPPWTDEFSTLVFSLGNSFLGVPLNQAIAPDVLLKPLQPQATATLQDVWQNLSHETNHPPIYFALAHLWMGLFPTQQGLVSLWGARSLAAILGAATIPAMYIFGWIAFRSRLVAHLAAAMMAVSPYAIFLAQEARHYTLAILWVIASLACFVIATRHIQNHTQLPITLAVSWVIINALGIASHYFFVLTLCTEALVLIVLLGKQLPIRPSKLQPELLKIPLPTPSATHFPVPNSQSPTPSLQSPPWPRILAVALGSLIAGIVWIPVFLQNSYGEELTNWIQQPRVGFAWLSPFFQAFAAWVTMLYLLPVESPHLVIIIASGLVMLIFMIWAAPILVRGLKVKFQQPETRLTMQVLTGVVVSAIALFFVFTYFLGIDLTRGARYNFVYFPAVIALLGASLAATWHHHSQGRTAVMIIWLMGFVSAVTVICNLGYQKYYRPDLLVKLIQQTSQVPVLIATTQITHVQIGEMMGIAREFRINNIASPSPLFLLAHQENDPHIATNTLENTLKTLPRPFDLWLVNFHAPVGASVPECAANTQSLAAVNGYEYKIYRCLK